MNLNKSKYEYSQNDCQRKKILIDKGIKQAWNRRYSNHIHSGVRVKIQRKNNLFINQQIHCKSKSTLSDTTNHIQSMLKRLWIESETSALNKKPLELIQKSYKTKPILNNSFLEKNMISIGIQTIIITKIDQQTSCNIIRPIVEKNHKNRSLSSSSSTSLTETLTSDENSTCTNNTLIETSTISSTTSYTKRNKNRNNNAIENDIECDNNQITIKEFITEKSKIQLSNNQQSLQDIRHGYSQSTLLSRKKRFFNRFFNLFSFLQLSSFKQDRICTSTTPVITDADQNKGNKIVQLPTSRCRRRSKNRNFNCNSLIQPKTNYIQIETEENSSSKLNYLEQKISKYSISDTSILTNKQINNSHSQKRRSNKINRRKHKYRRHRKKQKYIQSSHSQLTISSTGNNQSKLQNEENLDADIHSTNNCLEVKEISFTHSDIENNPSEKCIDNLTTEMIPSNTLSSFYTKQNDYQHDSFHPSIDPIRLRVKNKNLISTLSKPNIPRISIDHVDDKIQTHQMNLVKEFKSLLEQTKNIHINNNAFDDDDNDLIINTSSIPFKKDIKEISTLNQSNIEVEKNQNENKYQRTSILSSDSQSVLTENKSIDLSQEIQEQNKIIQEGVEQLIRYQKYAKQYKLKSNKTVKEFLIKSKALSSESLYKLSINNEPYLIHK